MKLDSGSVVSELVVGSVDPIPTWLCHVIYCCGDKSYPCLVGIRLQDKHKLVIQFEIFRISYGDGLETPMDAVILVLKSPQLTGTPWMIWSQVKFIYSEKATKF